MVTFMLNHNLPNWNISGSFKIWVNNDESPVKDDPTLRDTVQGFAIIKEITVI